MAQGEGRVFERLKASCPEDWQAYTEHDFVRQLASGELPEAAFRHYLAQDYVFLKHFARAYALAATKSETLEEMRAAAGALTALINEELRLHIAFSARWGLDEASLEATEEAPANLAYTRFVLDRGHSGDLLDLLVALAPCVLGYGEIGARLLGQASDQDNPYRPWIETYGGADYQELCAEARAQLDAVARRRIGPAPWDSGRWPSLAECFRTATRLEIGFWDMGLRPEA